MGILVALCVVGSAVAAPQLGRSRSVVSSVGANVNENQVVTSVITSLPPPSQEQWKRLWLRLLLLKLLLLRLPLLKLLLKLLVLRLRELLLPKLKLHVLRLLALKQLVLRPRGLLLPTLLLLPLLRKRTPLILKCLLILDRMLTQYTTLSTR